MRPTAARGGAGFTIAIPHLNTTLSRVDVFEIAAIVEVLLALRHCDPRNVTPAIAANLRRDVVSFVRHMPVHSRDRPGASRASGCATRPHTYAKHVCKTLEAWWGCLCSASST